MSDNTEVNFDKLIYGQIEIKQKWQKVVDEIELRKALGKPDKLDKAKLAEAKQNIKISEDAITELNKDRDDIAKLETSELQASTIAEEKLLIKKLIDQYNIGFLISENKYIYCSDVSENGNNISNPIFGVVEGGKFGRIINKMAQRKLKLGNRTLSDELADYFQEIGKDYFMTTCSFNDAKWCSSQVYNKAHIIMKFWVQPDWDNATNYDKRFDFLINCVGGGKQENIDHLEQWLAYKYVFPERVANTPSLDIGGHPGGNGKGRYKELSNTIFTNKCVSAATLDELTKFNSNWEMSVLLCYDEPEQNELPEGKLKNATGSEDMRIEKKGVDATMVDRNYSFLFLSNNANGVVKLAGTGAAGEDRRYSVIATNLVMVDEAIKHGFASNLDEAKIFVNSVNDLIKDRAEVSKWLAHIITKHDITSIQVLHPLHGQDYHARFNDQKTAMDNAFDDLLPVLQKYRVLPFEILKACVITITGWDKITDKKIKQEFKRYLEKNRVSVSDERVYINYSFNGSDTLKVQKPAYVLSDNPGKDFDFNSVLRKKPFDMRKAKESCEHRDMLLFCDN